MLATLRKYSTTDIADACDALGLEGTHCRNLKLLSAKAKAPVVGYAHTVQFVDGRNKGVTQSKGHHVDSASKDSVVCLALPQNLTSAAWGGLMCQGALNRGAVGAVVDGRARDLAELNGLDFPVFAQGLSVHGNKGKGVRVSVGQPITLDSVGVCQGDVVHGDENGVMVIPAGRVADVLAVCAQLVPMDAKCMQALKQPGATISGTFKAHRTEPKLPAKL